jgi:hypothetical protein
LHPLLAPRAPSPWARSQWATRSTASKSTGRGWWIVGLLGGVRGDGEGPARGVGKGSLQDFDFCVACSVSNWHTSPRVGASCQERVSLPQHNKHFS